MPELHVEVDDFTDPWSEREAILLLHGFAESGRAWFAWVPRLARGYRVVRPDLRGFGASPVPPRAAERTWSVQEFADDIARLLDELELERARARRPDPRAVERPAGRLRRAHPRRGHRGVVRAHRPLAPRLGAERRAG